MKKVLCLFDYGKDVNTGYATVSKNIVSELKKHFGKELHLDICAINYYGEQYSEYGNTVNIVSGKFGQRKPADIDPEFADGDNFGRLFFLEKLAAIEYDGVFILQDLGTIAPIIPRIREILDIRRQFKSKVFKSIIYFPVDGPIETKVKNAGWNKEEFDKIPKSRQKYFPEYIRQLDELEFFDTIVTYTEFAKEEILKHKPSLASRINVLYHGTNTCDFYPTNKEEKNKFRNEYFGDNADKFIVGLINKNAYRKDIPTAIYGFIYAKKLWNSEMPKPFLYLHMNAEEPTGMNLRGLLSMTNLIEGVDYCFPKRHIHKIDVQTLNNIYNSIDVYLSTAMGEGYGLSASESMACKIPCIVPNHTSLGEIGANGRAYLLEEFMPVSGKEDHRQMNMCHYEEAGSLIAKVARNLSNTNNNTEANRINSAYEWAISYTWERVCKEWVSYFETTFKMK